MNALLDNISYYLSSLAYLAMMYCLKRIFFLEQLTDRQKKVVRTLFILYAILEIPFLICNEYMLTHEEHALPWDVVYLLLMVGTILLEYVILVYSSWNGRKKRKWLSLFVSIPMLGFTASLDALTKIPTEQLGLLTAPYSYFYTIVIYTALMLLFAWLVVGKNRPDFIRRLEEDANVRSLSPLEEMVIWFVGIWLLAFDFMNLLELDGMRSEVIVYLHASNLVLACMITALVINGSYRKFYYSKNMQLQRTLITTMANLVESRDENTGGHIQRTAKYVEIISRKLRENGMYHGLLTDGYLEDMIIAAPLHDVGKIHIPDAILNKPGRLDEEEFNTMKSHSAAGGRIIEQVEQEVGDITYLRIAREMAEYHHERMDGNGYPHGLSGEEIPLCARILAVADVFDALCSKRCYKEAMPLDQAFAIIEEGSGTHFDREVVAAFLSAREEIEAYLAEPVQA